jgi:D-proline reductase (dithiol) PrdB
VFGCARDIVEHCGVPRFVFTDYPLGNPCGKPYDVDNQRVIVAIGLDLLQTATRPVTVVAPFVWSADESWKERVFTKEQPFLDETATAKWLERKQAYREQKMKGATP